MRQTTQSMSKLPSALLMAPSKRFALTASAVSSAPIAPSTALIAPSKRWMCTPAYVFKGSGVTFYREMFSASSKCRRLCTKSRVEMEVFPLRPSAYLCVLCVNGAFQRREPQRYAEAAEKTNQICHFLCKANAGQNYELGRLFETSPDFES